MKDRVDVETRENNFAINRARDEIAVDQRNVCVGAGWNGARAFTTTSGPGISLMNEFIGLAYFAEIPVTIIDVQRGGPSTGMPTRTQQSDVLACAYASHGDTKHVLLFPEDPHECFEFSAQALDLADRLQTPIFVLTDLDIGMNQRLSAPFAWGRRTSILRPWQGRWYRRVNSKPARISAATRTSMATAFRIAPIRARTQTRVHISLSRHFARCRMRWYSRKGPDYIYQHGKRLLRKFDTAKALVPQPSLPREAGENRSRTASSITARRTGDRPRAINKRH